MEQGAKRSQNELRHRGSGAANNSDGTEHVKVDISEETQKDNKSSLSPEQVKRLKKYMETAIIAVGGSVTQFAMTSLQEQANYKLFLAPVLPLIIITISIIILKMHIDDEGPKARLSLCSPRICILMYGSNLILMLAPLYLLVLHTATYALLALLPILALVVIIFLFRQGCSTKNYTEHDDKLNNFMKLSTVVTILAFAGLLGFVFSKPVLPKQNLEIKATECFLYCTVVISLLVMLLTSVPPAALDPAMTVRMVKVMKSLCNTLLALLIFVGLMATAEILQGFAVISIFVHITGATVWFIKELKLGRTKGPDAQPKDDENICSSSSTTATVTSNAQPKDDINVCSSGSATARESSDAQPKDDENICSSGSTTATESSDAQPKDDEESLPLVFGSTTLCALLFVYSKHVNNSDGHTQVNDIPLRICMIMLCSTFISCLSRMFIISNSANSRAWTSAKDISYCLIHYSVIVLLAAFFVLGCFFFF